MTPVEQYEFLRERARGIDPTGRVPLADLVTLLAGISAEEIELFLKMEEKYQRTRAELK